MRREKSERLNNKTEAAAAVGRALVHRQRSHAKLVAESGKMAFNFVVERDSLELIENF